MSEQESQVRRVARKVAKSTSLIEDIAKNVQIIARSLQQIADSVSKIEGQDLKRLEERDNGWD